MKIFLKRLILTALIILGVGFLIPQNLKMPVVGAGSHSYNHETFWYEGWGSSIVHKGVDIFARKGTRINSATMGLVLATGELGAFDPGESCKLLGLYYSNSYIHRVKSVYRTAIFLKQKDLNICYFKLSNTH